MPGVSDPSLSGEGNWLGFPGSDVGRACPCLNRKTVCGMIGTQASKVYAIDLFHKLKRCCTNQNLKLT
jgi:hypothetical protein